ncbi:MAG TPA: C-terminal helicase domain-containing protein, partial [Gemmatimonadales bacterium]
GGVCALTSREALVAGGRLSRAEALRRFAPLAHRAPEPPEAERVTLLLSTDVASEGLDLTDASVVVHLDMPWTPARLAQRVGRLTRLGSPHTAIAVHALVPPEVLSELVGVERALHAKRDTARRLMGDCGVGLPPGRAGGQSSDLARGSSCVHDDEPSALEAAEGLRRVLERWRDDCARTRRGVDTRSVAGAAGPPLVAAVEAEGVHAPAFLALLSGGDGHRLVADESTRAPPTDDPRTVLRVAQLVNHERGIDVDPYAAGAAHAAAAGWIAHHRARDAMGAVGDATLRLQRQALARIAAIVRDTPLHHRPRITAAAAAARHTLARPLAAAAERQLAELALGELPGERWLHAIARLGDDERAMHDARAPVIVALLLVVPERSR